MALLGGVYSCHPLGFEDCTVSVDTFVLLFCLPSSIVLTMITFGRFYNKTQYKTIVLVYTGLVVTIVSLTTVVLLQIDSAGHDIYILWLTLAIVWVSLLTTFNPLRNAPLGWVVFSAFLIYVAVSGLDSPALLSLVCALFSGGAALYKTRAKKIAGYTGLATCLAILAMVTAMGFTAVAEWGMPPPGYELLIITEGFSRAHPYADGVMILGGAFISIIPLARPFLVSE